MKSEIIDDHRDERKLQFNKQFGIYHNGINNLTPLIIENLIDRSPTAKRAVNMYSSFLVGGGFSQEFKGIDLDPSHNKRLSPDKLLFQIGKNLAKHEGCYIHVQYNAFYKKVAYKVIPYNLCRVGKKDDNNFSGKIVVSPEGWGRHVKKSDAKAYDVFNDRPEVVREQVKKAGGIQNYLGQIYYFKFDDEQVYSTSLIESVAAYCDTEYKMGLFFNSTVDNGFTDVSVVYHKKPESDTQLRNLKDNLRKVKGVKNSNKTLLLESTWEQDPRKDGAVVFDTIKSDEKPDRYQYFDEAAENKIVSPFEIPLQLVKLVAGKLGNTSGEDLKMWTAIYNTRTAPKRQMIEECFEDLFRNYYKPFNASNDWTIKQYALLSDGTTADNADDLGSNNANSFDEDRLNKEAQATLRGSVGGVTGVLSIQSSVSSEVTDYSSGVTMLEEIFGYSNEVARKILGTPKKGASNPSQKTE